ncbi:MAG: DNA alkylation repair protein [Pseudomonadota bacterium]
MSAKPKRTGATRVADVPAEVLRALEAGTAETATLAEALAIDFNPLLADLLDADDVEPVPASLGITRRMALAAERVQQHLGHEALARCQSHPSDTVRGWGAYVVAGHGTRSLRQQLKAIRPFADDAHFAVREWAWLALRPQLVAEFDAALTLLLPWVRARSANVRRFASEALRPRGVWCSHIGALKANPGLALPLLESLRADPSRYVQDSVGNWLNDAHKSQPDWVTALCATWAAESDTDATRYIVKRALRNAR